MRTAIVLARLLYLSIATFLCAGVAQAQIHVTEARIGCLDLKENAGNLTTIVGNACNSKSVCSFKAPTPAQYNAEHVNVHGRFMCTQGMEITYRCGSGADQSVGVPGDAWNHDPAVMDCSSSTTTTTNSGPVVNPQLVPVLQQLLAKYRKCMIEQYESPTPPNPAIGPLRDIAQCVAGNTCTAASRRSMFDTLQAQANRGDATNFESNLKTAILGDCFQCGKHAEWHTKQMHCTWDCGGNQSWATDPFHFNAGTGPCFETCKAGVDIERLINDIVTDIHNVLQGVGLAGNNEPGSKSGGLTVSANHNIVDPSGVAEACSPGPDGYYIAPAGLLDWTVTEAPKFKDALTNYDPPSPPKREQYDPAALSKNSSEKPNIGANEGRLRADLRAAAARHDPVASLCESAAAFAAGKPEDGNAFADLSVSGRQAFAEFRARPPQDAQILACLQGNALTRSLPASTLQKAADEALDRAYRVVNVVRASGWPLRCKAERDALGYIAVSGEDDQPLRPLNVPTAEFAQYEIDVPVKRPSGGPLSVHTRFMIAHTITPAGGEPPSCAGTGRTIPADRAPVLAADAIVFLYIHGMDSRLEEALDLTHALHALGRQRNRNYTVISMDLPTSGYADNIDYNLIAPLTADGHAGGGLDGLGFAPNKYVVPVVDFDEDFIVSFVNTLDHSTGVTRHDIYPIGGSLGGNMSFRLGRPRQDAPWIKTVIPWSPAAIWPSLADDGAKHAGLATPWYFAGGDPAYAVESPGSRRSFFYGGFDWQSKAIGIIPLGGGKPQAEYWYRNGWQCKPAHMLLSRIDRYETYNPNFRRWHWRLGMEQLQFSQQEGRPPLYLTNTKRMLLLCGMDDTGGDLCKDTRDVAPLMEITPGKALFLKTTGHSIHNERPNYLAQQIIDFVDPGSVQVSPPLLSFQASTCETLDGKSCTATKLPAPGAPGSKSVVYALKAKISVSSKGKPLQGVAVSVPGKSAVTDTAGIAVIAYDVHSIAVRPSGDAVAGTRGKPANQPVWYAWQSPVAQISKAGYHSEVERLPGGSDMR